MASQDAHGDLGIDKATLRRLAVEADVDPRTIIRELRAALGQRKPVRGMAGHRARKVLAEKGLIQGEKAA